MSLDVDLCAYHNNQSLLVQVVMKIDSGVTNFGKEAIKEMNKWYSC